MNLIHILSYWKSTAKERRSRLLTERMMNPYEFESHLFRISLIKLVLQFIN